jgi:hypothetical protein
MVVPKVSVVMPVYNGAKYLAEAIDSILAQSYCDYELIIVDDGSHDNSASIAAAYTDPRVRMVRQENRGVAVSLNRGVALSRGEYIARMDADDVSDRGRLELQMAYLDANPACVLVGTQAILIDAGSHPLAPMPRPTRPDDIKRMLARGSSPFVHGSVVFRKDAASSCGLYDERFRNAEDWALWAKMEHTGLMANLASTSYRYRLHPDACTNQAPRFLKQHRKALANIYSAGLWSEASHELPAEVMQRNRLNPRDRRAQYYLTAGKVLIENEWQPARARGYIERSLLQNPWNAKAWINFGFCFLPRSLVAAWKHGRIN